MDTIRPRKLLNYYGAKTWLMEDILKFVEPLYNNKQLITFVDVFGGSGTVLLNLPLKWHINKVYNDLDQRMVNLLNDLRDDYKRNLLFERIYYTIPSRDMFNKIKENNLDDSFDILYRIFYSFNHNQNSYGINVNTYRPPFNSQFKNLSDNWQYLRNWNIENLDYKELIKRYDSNRTFFYLDPPYLTGGEKYNFKFTTKDFLEMHDLLGHIKGYWLMNESDKDYQDIVNIFGDPVFENTYKNHSFHNRNALLEKNKNSKRIEYYWSNFKPPFLL